ncbi:hypothetical protein SLEP1_g45338 [Rubroshorea leprosula]|uniref:Uncharacterized protein n=1 Tax=Rubroshorea leprosula TaxID=152421 RepID=A0AAV5LIP7_9ROSI|nr:hypothetical protein SLEP1_g45338 [Rubroshorea leprosula]
MRSVNGELIAQRQVALLGFLRARGGGNLQAKEACAGQSKFSASHGWAIC